MVPAVAAGVRDAGLQILGNAQDLAPVGGGIYSPRDPAPGTLKASGTPGNGSWLEPLIEGNKVTFLIGFNTVYAVVQHERLDFRHEAPGQAKYLEIPLAQAVSEGMVERSIQHHVDLLAQGAGGNG